MTADPFQLHATRSGPSLADYAWYLLGVVGLYNGLVTRRQEVKNGLGPAPIKTPEGWLHLAHGVRGWVARDIESGRLAITPVLPVNVVPMLSNKPLAL